MAAQKSGALLQQLRQTMKNSAYVTELIHAYIIPTDDAHQSEYIADCDMRRVFISGFTGSAGTAVVTETSAALWTDGRYHLQASNQLDMNHWTLMKEPLPEVPTQAEWLAKVLPQEGGRVGVDPFLLSAASWIPLAKKLKGDGHELVPVNKNLIDVIWKDRPQPPSDKAFVQPIKFCGESWPEKIKKLRQKMQKKSATSLVITALDEVAWLLNLRGNDIKFNPCFFSYVIVTMNDV